MLSYRKTLMFLLLQIVLAAAGVQNRVSPDPNFPNLNVTSHVEDYILANKRQYARNIADYESRIANFKANFAAQADNLAYEATVLNLKIDQIVAELEPLESLSLLTKHCYQKYDWLFPDMAPINTNINSCVSTARSAITSSASYLETTKNTLNSYYIGNYFTTDLNKCAKNFPNTSTPEGNYNYTLCVTNVVTAANVYTVDNQNTFNSRMETYTCSMENNMKTAIKCVFPKMFDAISKTSQAKIQIENCIKGLEYRESCEEDYGRCHTLNLTYDEIAVQNNTIPNPFYGLSDYKCFDVQLS